MLMKIEHSASFIKAREYLAACDALDFRYKVNQFGQTVFEEGGDWEAFAAIRKHFGVPSIATLKALLLSLGRMEAPYVPSKEIGMILNPDGSEWMGVAA